MAAGSGETSTSPLPHERIRLLLIDDEADTLAPVLTQGLEPLGFSLTRENDPTKAPQAVEACAPDAILLDLHFPGDDESGEDGTTGGRLMTLIRQRFGSVPVLVFTTRLDDVDIPLETFEERPHGYFSKPEFDRQGEWACQLARAVRDAMATARHAGAAEVGDLDFVVGQTPEMHEAAAAIRTAAGNRLTVLIYGETGTGKRRAAEAIHRLSGRTGRFAHYNCSGVDFKTAEATLFGAPSGGGLLELANGGTLFLDEIQDLPNNLQDRVLTAVECGRPRRTGVASDHPVEARLVVATNHNLSDLVHDGVLREGLAYRLAGGLPVSLSPLRQRMADLPALFARFVDRANTEAKRQVSEVLRPETQKFLEAHAWPGNIRELESTLTRAVATTNSNVLLPEHIVFVPITRPDAASSQPGTQPVAQLRPARAAASGDIHQAVAAVTDSLMSLPVNERYGFLKSQGDSLRKDVLVEFVRRLRAKYGKRIQHKVLAAELDPLEDPDRDLNRIRQFLHGSGVRLTKLAFNR